MGWRLTVAEATCKLSAQSVMEQQWGAQAEVSHPGSRTHQESSYLTSRAFFVVGLSKHIYHLKAEVEFVLPSVRVGDPNHWWPQE